MSPTSITLTPGTPQKITFSAATRAPNGTSTVTFTGTAASLKHTAALGLTVTGGSNPGPGRTRYVRTDASTEYYFWLNQHWILYHTPTSRYFVADPTSNQIIVMDAASETKVASISVPGAFGIDDTPDHKTLYVGTLIGDVYVVDPVAMTVLKRYIATEIGPYGFSGLSVLVLADGRLALLGSAGGIPAVDGSPAFAIWTPADNSISIYATQYGADEMYGVPFTVVCGAYMGNIGGFTRTVDRTKVIVGSIDSDGTLCEVDEAGRNNFVETTGFSLNHILTTPDGKYIVQPNYPTDAVIYDAHTLNKVAEFSVLGDTSSASGFAISADSKTLFTPSDTIIYAYDLATHQQTGWLPNIFVPFTSGGSAAGPITGPYLLATDGTGLFAGPLEEGVGFVDLSVLRTGPVGTQFTNGYLNPATGPAAGGTATQWSEPNNAGPLGSVYFGAHQATAISAGSGVIDATSPSGTPGPVDVYAFTTDGGMELLPEAFSYGPTILEVTPNMATAEGGEVGIVYGYGFGPENSNVIPSDLHVTIAGTQVEIIAFGPNAYNSGAPPFPLQALAYRIHPGKIGSVDVTVSTNAGTETAHGALTYIPSIQQFPLTGSALAQGIYDSSRDLYYFTDATKIQVFSRTSGKWLPSVSIPAPSGTTQRLWGLALSPDGSKLAIADASAEVIYLVDPSDWSTVNTFPVPQPGTGAITNACAVAVSDAGIVYFAAYVQGGTGYNQFFKLDTNTGAVTAYPNLNGPGSGTSDVYLRTVMSSDNTRVFFNMYGYVFSIDTATDKIFSATVDPACCYGDYELALSSNQTQFTATSYLYDSDLNGESTYALNDREILNISYVYGAKLSPDGRLLFQPSTVGIDVLDGRLGTLLTRISLPVPLSLNYDALVADGKDNILVAITGTNGDGIAIIDLTSIGEPPPLPYNRRIGARMRRSVEAGNLVRSERQLSRQLDKKGPRPATPRRAVPHVTRSVFPHAR